MVEIDGAYGEGGGQILRTSLSLAALTGQALKINNIRTRRDPPGLRPQHVTAVQAIAKITRAKVEGALQGSQSLTLTPGKIQAGTYRFETPTAGALSLVLETLSLPLSLAGGSSWVTLTGGTHVPWSPNFHYLQEQWLPVMKALGFRLAANLDTAGFFPRGGGKVSLKVLPCKEITPLNCLTRGPLVNIRGLSGVANLENNIAARQKHQALKRLYPVCRDSKIKTLQFPSPGKGTFILLKANFENCGSACCTALGAPGKPAEQVADEAVDQIFSFLDTQGSLDQYLADQILLPLALAQGRSSFRTNAITGHLLSNAHVIRQFLPAKIEIQGAMGNPGRVSILGTALTTLNNL